MKRLISKLQFKNFEQGEFIEVQDRTYEEVVELIEKYPWNIQREKIIIDLTNPSITIEGKNNDFLKFGLFFNQKYVLHYFDKTQTLYTKSFLNLKDAYGYIRSFYEQAIFDAKDFKKETTWFQNNLKHFVTQDFRYELTKKSIRSYLLSTSGMNFYISIFFLILVLSKGLNSVNSIGLIVLLILLFLIGGGLHLILFFNYYIYSKNKVLIMSKGNDIFYFGDKKVPSKYDKKDILQYTTIRTSGSRNPFNGFAIIKIELKNGNVLKIPNLMIDYLALENKLFEYPKVDLNKLPFL